MDSQAQQQRQPSADELTRQAQLDRLKTFLATAPSRWSSNNQQQQQHHHHHQAAQYSSTASSSTSQLPAIPTSHPALNRFLLPSGEYVSCVLWAGLYHITGTDIVRALVFRFEAFGRPVINMKKFEEGVFSDLRNLKPGTDACLEEPKSPFLDLLFKFQCIRTQKKQKVFYWFSVPHDRLFLDALERDLKREKMGQESTTVPRGEPGLSFTYDPKRTLYEQFLKPTTTTTTGTSSNNSLTVGLSTARLLGGSTNAEEEEDDDELLLLPGDRLNAKNQQLSVVSPADIMARRIKKSNNNNNVKLEDDPSSTTVVSSQQGNGDGGSGSASALPPSKETFLKMFSLFEGSPTYKQRRKKPSGSGAGALSASLKANAAENSRRRSTLASEVVTRRESSTNGRRASMIAAAATTTTTNNNSGAESPVALNHPSLAGTAATSVHPSLGNNRYQQQQQQSSAPSSRPGSQHQQHQVQQLPNYGLSTNRGAQEQDQGGRDEYMPRQQLHHSPGQMSPHELADEQRRPSTANSGAPPPPYMCHLVTCQRVFATKDQLDKHYASHNTGAILQNRWKERRDVARGDSGADDAAGLKFPCEGCFKVYTRAENLRLHMSSCAGRASRGNTADGSEMEMSGLDMDMEGSGNAMQMETSYDDEYAHAHAAHVHHQHGLNLDLAYAHRDIGSSHGHHPGHPPNSAGSNAHGQYASAASAETSPYVETPEGGGAAQWVNVSVSPIHPRTMHHIPEHHEHQPHSAHHQAQLQEQQQHHQQQQHQHQQHQEQHQAHQYHPLAGLPVLSHHLSWQNLASASATAGSGLTSPPDSANSAQRSVFGAQQQQQIQQGLHARYRSPDAATAYGYGHPSSAPSQKVTFDQGSLYPPSYQHPLRPGAAMSGVSLRRYRSATPMMTGGGAGGLRAEYQPQQQQQQHDSRPASSAGGDDYGSVVVNPAAAGAHPFAYSVDSGDGRLSYVAPGSAHGGVVMSSSAGAVVDPMGGPGSDHSSPQSYGNIAMVNGEYVESNSQYDGSNGSPGSAGHGGGGGGGNMMPMAAAAAEARIMVAMPPPPRGHIHSLSSEIATQQMQQYVDLDGLVEDGETSYQQQAPVSASAPPSYQSHAHVRHPQESRYHEDARYMHAEQQQHQQAVVGAAYHSSSSEGGHEEMYPYRFQPQAAMHPHHSEHAQQPYPSRYYHEQRVAL